jgi:antitoxin (DNA-binding transcriptional repressor) of toxin-antitoxin stability system
MKSVSVRDLRYDFKKVELILGSGHEVAITKRRRVIARLVPESIACTPLPDFLARIKSTYGAKSLPVTGAEVVRLDRDR